MNVTVQGVGHLGLLVAPHVAPLVADSLREDLDALGNVAIAGERS